jgi:hypothetical protein
MKAFFAFSVYAAIKIPSISVSGLFFRINLSLNVPGSPSSALHIR